MAKNGTGFDQLNRMSRVPPPRESMRFELQDGGEIKIVIRRPSKKGATAKVSKANWQDLASAKTPKNVKIDPTTGTISINAAGKHVRVYAYESNSSDVIVDSNCP